MEKLPLKNIILIKEDFDSLDLEHIKFSNQFNYPDRCPIAKALKRIYGKYNSIRVLPNSYTIKGVRFETKYTGLPIVKKAALEIKKQGYGIINFL